MLDLGLIQQPIAFLSTKETAMPSVILAHVWRSFPFYAMSFLAGMQTIPLELYEAAQVDGASRWQQFRYITLPSLYHIIGVVVLLTTIWTANAFEPIYLLTGGGPSDATTVYTMLVYVMGYGQPAPGRGGGGVRTVPAVAHRSGPRGHRTAPAAQRQRLGRDRYA
jgi:ABC-type sugar transport system permease subunit